jgi:hypothetical protein
VESGNLFETLAKIYLSFAILALGGCTAGLVARQPMISEAIISEVRVGILNEIKINPGPWYGTYTFCFFNQLKTTIICKVNVRLTL